MSHGYFGDGAYWTLATGAGNIFPADKLGGATTTNTASVLFGARIVQLCGHIILTAGAPGSTITYANNGGANFPGLVFPADAANLTEAFPPNEGARLVRFTNANVCVKLSDAATVALFFWRKLA